MKPFLKYPGGKAALAERILDTLDVREGTVLVEPFLGAGAVALAALDRGATVLASDLSLPLVRTWAGVLDYGPDVLAAIADLEVLDLTDAVYRDIRATFNVGLYTPGHAAYAIYLNRACFNGLWRFNADGDFNVPWGKKSKVTVAESAKDTIKGLWAWKLAGMINVVWASAFEAVDDAPPGAVVYLDPPYVPSKRDPKRPAFTAYGVGSEPLWTFDDTLHLVDVVRDVGRRCVLSYSADPVLVQHLTATGWHVEHLDVKRTISRDGDGRKPAREILASWDVK